MAMDTSKVVTRFAPSPTGFLHIGGARTALFNWLLARRHGGKFILRIEDTDRARSTDEAITAILDGLKWLGLHWDGDEVYQSQHADRHREIAEVLLDKGHAYKCYASQEELAEMREKQKAAGQPIRYDGRWRDRDPAEAPAGVKPVIRIKAPQDGETVIEDAVQGRVKVPNSQLDDMVLLRGDGTPTYMMAVVVDDHDLGITHIVRGDDHLTNAFRQKVIYDAMGWDVPQFAHIPLIHGPDGAKLSKRHGALGVEAYRDMGYLPEALRNYLLRLGWGMGDTELIPTEEAIKVFDLKNVGKGAARFDFKKLESFNAHYMKTMDIEELARKVRPFLEKILESTFDESEQTLLIKALPSLRERAKTLVALAENAAFYFQKRPLSLDEKARHLVNDKSRAIVREISERLQQQSDWTATALHEAVASYAEDNDLKLGKVAQPLRAALTGTTVSPSVFEVMEILGREESLGRLEDVTG